MVKGGHMVIRRERFVIGQGEARGVARTDSTYRDNRGKGGDSEVHSYTLEIYLFERGSIFLDYDEDKEARDADFEAVAAVIM